MSGSPAAAISKRRREIATGVPSTAGMIPLGISSSSPSPPSNSWEEQHHMGLAPPPPPLWPQGSEAVMLLAEYRTQMAPLFPFVVIPPGIDAEELRGKRPFLWKGVMMQACHLDRVRQTERATSCCATSRPRRSRSPTRVSTSYKACRCSLLGKFPWFSLKEVSPKSR